MEDIQTIDRSRGPLESERSRRMLALSEDRVWFVAERFEQLRDLLLEFGYALDPGPRDPNEWHELHYEEPPTGVVRLKGVRLRDFEDDDSDFDPEITFSIEELILGFVCPHDRARGICPQYVPRLAWLGTSNATVEGDAHFFCWGGKGEPTT
jgi:hypothetical protein